MTDATPFSIIDATLNDSTFLLLGPRADPNFGSAVTIKRFNRAFCVRHFDLSILHGISPALDDESIFKSVTQLGTGPVLRPGTQLRGSKPLVWLAPIAHLEAAIEDLEHDQIASHVRDLLGLSHFFSDEYLIQIQIPASNFESLNVRRPLAFDAGPNLIFQTNASTDPHGYSVNLESTLPGLPEVVSEPITLTAEYVFAGLGYLRRTSKIQWRTLLNPDFERIIQSTLQEIEDVLGTM